METTQFMSRELHGIKFTQNHKTQFVNLTELVDNFNKNKHILNRSKESELEVFDFKRVQNFLDNQQTKDFLAALAKDECCEIKDLMQAKRGRYGGTWAHPLIFVKICCWLSPEFEVAALRIIYDHLLEYRDSSGEAYKILCIAMDEKGLIRNYWDYAKIGKAISIKILGTSKKGCWNTASEEQLQARNDVEVYLTQLIIDGFVTGLNMALLVINNRNLS